jgi:hypothetical protein
MIHLHLPHSIKVLSILHVLLLLQVFMPFLKILNVKIFLPLNLSLLSFIFVLCLVDFHLYFLLVMVQFVSQLVLFTLPFFHLMLLYQDDICQCLIYNTHSTHVLNLIIVNHSSGLRPDTLSLLISIY